MIYTRIMFQIEVSHRFSAAHAVTVGGVREELHGHDWGVTVLIEGSKLDHEDLLVDFHVIEVALRAAISPFSGRTMNGTPPFDVVHPTAERLAEFVAGAVQPEVPSGLRIASVAVEEAPGCIARWFPD
ncbi:MAG: 6-carboxytetrahydropterin synthase [Phycisphaerales bacterium]|jgi:6-pyruvoyltetrahydropterin/6-carboxytetrahydropterin synthase|nr:6-carboxytetrahydropterin synthase [Phycisphaerales bacterium]